MLSGARVGVGCRVAVGTSGELDAVVTATGCCPGTLFCNGRKGSYVGRIICVGTAGAQAVSRNAESDMAEISLFKYMSAILPVDNCKPEKQKRTPPFGACVLFCFCVEFRIESPSRGCSFPIHESRFPCFRWQRASHRALIPDRSIDRALQPVSGECDIASSSPCIAQR